LLIDATHKRWFWVTLILAVAALAGYGVLAWRAPEGWKGGSTAGLWYGTIGALLMVYAGLLAAHRRLMRWQWLGRRQTWLRGHIWLGLLSGVFLLCHSGFHWGGTLTICLWIAVGGTLLTGIFGLLLQQWLPRTMTTRVPAEAPYEQIPHLCAVMRHKADGLVDAVCGQANAPIDLESTRAAVRFREDGRMQLRLYYEQDVRPFLAPRPPRQSPLLSPLRTEARFGELGQMSGLESAQGPLAELAGLCDERRQLVEQERLYLMLHAWLLLHLPLSAAVLVLGVAHIIATLYY
jgi:hypothetical protein